MSIVETVVYAASQQAFIEGSATKLRGRTGGKTPSPDTVLRRMKELTLDQLLEIFEAFVIHTVYRARKKGFLECPVDIALDGHDEPYYGKVKPPEVRGTKEKRGTNYAYQYLVADIVVDGERFTLAIIPVPQLVHMATLVKKVLDRVKHLVPIRKVLMDRGFFSVEIVKILLDAGLTYEMPAPRTKGVKEFLTRTTGLRYAIEEFMVCADTTQVKTTIVMAPSTRKKRQMAERDPVFVFITNDQIEEKTIPEHIAHYDKRWGIETGFRVRKDVWIKTNTSNPLIRYLFFFLAAMLYDF